MASSDVFKAGFVINDRFEIKRLLGQGGFAMVFEGTDRNLDRQVAVKILHGAVLKSSEEDHRVIERFEREAKLAASVDHPSVVNIYDAGEINDLGEPFIVMEYLKGDSLQDYLDQNGPLEPEKFLPLFKDVLMGLGYAHELGIVHKDLKPDNIFYRYPDTMRESLCIVDFGIAHIGRSNSGRVTRDGEFFGTPSYMPPEYISEQKVSAAFDVYQMGLILIECLTGQPVVHHEDAVATLLMHLNRQFRIPDTLLQSEAWPVIERAIAANPSLRYKNALGFAEALHSLPLSAWPSRSVLAAVGIKSAKTEQPTVMGAGQGLGDGDSEVEDDIVDLWKQEDSFRTKSNDGATEQSSAFLPFASTEPEFKPSPNAEVIVDRSVELPVTTAPIDTTEEVPYADTSSSLVGQQSSKKLGLIALGLFLLIALAGGVVALLAKPGEVKGSSDEIVASQEKTPDAHTPKPPDEVVPPKDKIDAPPVDVTPPEKEPEPPQPEPVVVMISGKPTGARITDLSGTVLGETPFKLPFASKKDAPKTLIVTKDGYKQTEIQVTPELAQVGARYSLTKLRKAKTSGKKPAKTPEKQPEKQPEHKPEKTTVKVELPGKTTKTEEKKNTHSGSGILLPK